ncbi:MAG: aminoacyl-tRNA hydrolase [Melioribacteraceae bacterium]|nr:aminoacyl-tRNA hydrolase [Melioribacteraceae bacterium]
MRVILGIGNPGSKYEFTRHNAGFMALDYFAIKHRLKFKPSKKDYYKAGGTIRATDFFLVKPTTFVNLSGIAASDIVDEFNINLEDLLIVADDINLEEGRIRIKKGGSDGGHNGLKSIIYQLQTNNFPRLRIGIGNDFERGDMSDYVLDKFDEDTLNEIKPSFDLCNDLILQFIIGGTKSMSDHFSKISKETKDNNL